MPQLPESVTNADDVDPSVFWRWVWSSIRPVLGWVFLALGVILLFVCWYSVSGTSLVAKQIPYLVSAGFVGLAFVVFGARFLMIQDLRRDSGRLDRLETMVLELHAALLKRADAPDMSATLVRASSNGAGSYVALPGGTSFHKPDCVMLEGKQSASPVTAREVGARALVPCPLCEPAPVNA